MCTESRADDSLARFSGTLSQLERPSWLGQAVSGQLSVRKSVSDVGLNVRRSLTVARPWMWRSLTVAHLWMPNARFILRIDHGASASSLEAASSREVRVCTPPTSLGPRLRFDAKYRLRPQYALTLALRPDPFAGWLRVFSVTHLSSSFVIIIVIVIVIVVQTL
jgi:hypothetical protein